MLQCSISVNENLFVFLFCFGIHFFRSPAKSSILEQAEKEAEFSDKKEPAEMIYAKAVCRIEYMVQRWNLVQ